MYLINAVSRTVNLSQKRIREYEKEGFINPDRDPNTNNRLYSDFEIQQIKRINFLIHERGFTLSCLRNLLVLSPCWRIFDCRQQAACSAYEHPYDPCWQVRRTHPVKCGGPCEKCAIFLNRHVSADYVLEKYS
jgi:MerR family transcriptional regulator, repressor of the yfmOP operon